MALFGRSRPVVFEPHGRGRRRGKMPRWLVGGLVGVAVGAGGVLYVQERHLPPRLSYAAAQRLQQSYQTAEAERQRLAQQSAEAERRLKQALEEQRTLNEQLAASRLTIERLNADLEALVDVLPPDPRGGVVAVRAARFRAAGDALDYEVLLTREPSGERPLPAQMQVVVSGQGERGVESKLTMAPVAVAIRTHQSLSGRWTLPRGFTARQAAVRITDGPGGAVLGQRVLYVR